MVRLSYGEHRDYRVQPGDRVIFSARTIPGNERSILAMLDRFKRAGATVVTSREAPDLHVSGHAYEGDLQLLIDRLQPRHYIPVHGSFTHLQANHLGAAAHGQPHGGNHLMESGELIELSPEGLEKKGSLELAVLHVDRDSGVSLPYELLRERLRIGELGAAQLTGVFDRQKRAWLAAPQINLVGLALPSRLEPNRWLAETSRHVVQKVGEALQKNQSLHQGQDGDDTQLAREAARIAVRRRLAAVLNKKPVVLVTLHFV